MAHRGGHHTTALAYKPGLAQQAFSKLQAARQRRLREVQRLGRAAEVALLGQRHQVTQLSRLNHLAHRSS